MLHLYTFVFTILMALSCNIFAQGSSSDDKIPEHLKKYVPSQVYWQVKAGTEVPVFEDSRNIDEQELNQVRGLANIVENFEVNSIEKSFRQWQKDDEIGRTFTIHFKNNADFESLLRSLDELSATNLSERIPLVESFQAPNDPMYSQQWYLPHVDAENAWATNDCSGSNVIVAIVDDAVLTTHQDLASKIVLGYDVADGDSDPNPPLPINGSFFSHGTHVAGIVAAATNDNVGIASMGHDCLIMPVKTKKNSTTSNILDKPYDGILYAIDNGADVINMSWGGYAYSVTNANILSQAHNAGIICVAAVGNESKPFAAYPAAYPYVIGVGATNQSNQKASISNFGLNVDIMAPGVGIYSSTANSTNSYAAWNGTSMASPIVAGLAALYLCEHGSNSQTSSNTFAQCLYDNATDINSQNILFYQNKLGAGLIQAADALNCDPSSENDCTAEACQLAPNGDFETPMSSDLTLYTLLHAFELNEVCGWKRMTLSPQIMPVNPSADNFAFLWSKPQSGESIQTTQAINLQPNTTYVLEYDYRAVASSNGAQTYLDHIYITMEGQNVNPRLATGTVIDHKTNIQPTSNFQHRTVTFTTPSNTAHRYLSVYPRQNSGPGSNDPGYQGNLGIDNITITPHIVADAYAIKDTICEDICTQLYVNTSNSNSITWIGTLPVPDPVVCPNQTTTYTAIISNGECITTEDVTVVVDNATCCNDDITVEAVCGANGIDLIAYVNGVLVDMTLSGNPIYSMTWGSNGTPNFVDVNPVTYPIGTAYTLTIDVIYDAVGMVTTCPYIFNGVAEADLVLEVEAENDFICNYTCTQLSVNAPAGSTITWSNPDDTLDDPTSPTPQACPTGTTTYTVQVFDPASGCSGNGQVTIEVDEECQCDDIDIELVQECIGYNSVLRLLFNGYPIDPSTLDGLYINWDTAMGTSIHDANSVTLPTGADFEVYYYLDELGCEGLFAGTVDDCINCDFSVEESPCDNNFMICITMLDPSGLPVVPGPNGTFDFEIQWDYNQTTTLNQNPFCIPSNGIYTPTLSVSENGVSVCSNTPGNYSTSCDYGSCPLFDQQSVNINYDVEDDLVISWDPNGSIEYIVDVSHSYQGCSPSNTCTFSFTNGQTYVSLDDEGCFNTCQDYDITVTAICDDGTVQVVTLPTFFTYLGGNQACLACESVEEGKRNLDQKTSMGISIYPNPVRHTLNIDYNGTTSNPHIQIFDFSGKEVLSQQIDAKNTSIDVSNLPAAIYAIKISVDGAESVFDKIAILK